MAAKGTIQADHISANKFKLIAVGTLVPEFTVISLSGLEEELEVVDMPDRRRVSGGNTTAVEIEVETPAHHTLEQAAWEAWYKEAQDPVSPTYKKVATLVLFRIGGSVGRTFSLVGVFPRKRALSDLSMEDEGADVRITWTLVADEVTPI